LTTPISFASFTLPATAGDVYQVKVARNDTTGNFTAAVEVYNAQGERVGLVTPVSPSGHAVATGVIQIPASGSYSVLVFLTQRLLWPMTRLADMSDLYQRSMASVERVMNLVETKVLISYAGAPIAASDVKGALEFDNVDFSYGDVPTLQGISLKIAPGQSIAFVGGTGGGKSTLVKLLLRFYEPTSGTIRIDGRAISELDLQALRRCIGYVAQDSFLADATAAQNISYGLSDVSRAAVVAAAEAAEAHDFIAELPNGYDTEVGERGQKLSGGQRQRIALARAIVRNPRILVLDEATSAVDNETEAAIQRSLQRLVVGRTSLIIAHRLSTVRRADCIHVLEAGRIVESGMHDELVARGGVYASLWRLQTGEAPA
jgi:ATP-binding cassette subfamily B protein